MVDIAPVAFKLLTEGRKQLNCEDSVKLWIHKSI